MGFNKNKAKETIRTLDVLTKKAKMRTEEQWTSEEQLRSVMGTQESILYILKSLHEEIDN